MVSVPSMNLNLTTMTVPNMVTTVSAVINAKRYEDEADMMGFFTVLGMDIQKMIVSRGMYYELVFPVAENTDDTDGSRPMLKAIVNLKQVVRRRYADPEEHMAMIYLTMKEALIADGVLFGAFNNVEEGKGYITANRTLVRIKELLENTELLPPAVCNEIAGYYKAYIEAHGPVPAGNAAPVNRTATPENTAPGGPGSALLQYMRELMNSTDTTVVQKFAQMHAVIAPLLATATTATDIVRELHIASQVAGTVPPARPHPDAVVDGIPVGTLNMMANSVMEVLAPTDHSCRCSKFARVSAMLLAACYGLHSSVKQPLDLCSTAESRDKAKECLADVLEQMKEMTVAEAIDVAVGLLMQTMTQLLDPATPPRGVISITITMANMVFQMLRLMKVDVYTRRVYDEVDMQRNTVWAQKVTTQLRMLVELDLPINQCPVLATRIQGA
jgi:hypothetical protein